MKKILGILGSITLLSSTPISFIVSASSYSRANVNKSQKNNKNLNKKTDLNTNLNKNNCCITTINQKQKCKNTINRSNSTLIKKNKIKQQKYSNFTKNKHYKSFLREVVNDFQITKNVSPIGTSPLKGLRKIFKLEKNKNGDNHKIIPLMTNDSKIEVVLNTNNLYLDGFISGNDNNRIYWHFKNAKIKKIKDINSKVLPYTGHYSKIGNENLTISKNSINNSINNLSKFNGNNPDNIKDDLLGAIFITSESMRFFSIRDKVDQILNDSSNKTTATWGEYASKIKDWKKYSKKYYERIETGYGTENQTEHDKIFDISVLAPKSN